MAHNYYAQGQWNVICDRCGLEYKSTALRLEWTGLMVCGKCYEPRHPQTLIKAVPDSSSIPWARPEPTDVFVSVPEYINTESPISAIDAENGLFSLLTEG